MLSFVYKQLITPLLHLWVPNGNTAICYVQQLARCLHLSSLLIYNSVSFRLCGVTIPAQQFSFGLGWKVWGYTIFPCWTTRLLAHAHTQACIIMHEQTSRSLQNKQNAAWVNWVVIFSPITICLSHLVYLPFCIMKWMNVIFNEFMLWTDSISSKFIGQEWLENASELWSLHYLSSFYHRWMEDTWKNNYNFSNFISEIHFVGILGHLQTHKAVVYITHQTTKLWKESKKWDNWCFMNNGKKLVDFTLKPVSETQTVTPAT